MNSSGSGMPRFAAALPPTLAVVAVPLFILAPPILDRLGPPGRFRAVMVGGVPIVLALLAAGFTARRRGAATPSGDPVRFDARRAARILPWCGAAFILDHLYLYVARTRGWATFTFGDQALSAAIGRTAAWALPLCVVLGVIGWERALRGVLLRRWCGVAPRSAAVFIACGAGVLLAAPAIIGQAGVSDPAYLSAALISAAAREIGFTAIALGGGGVVLAGAYRGLLLYVEAFLVNDWYSRFFPAVNYVGGDPRLYVARAVAGLAAAAVLIAGVLWSRWAEGPRPPGGRTEGGRAEGGRAEGEKAGEGR